MTEQTPANQPDPDPAEPQVDPSVDDPDLQAASSQLEERDDPGALATERLEPDPDEDGYDPPQAASPVTSEPGAPSGDTPSSLDDRLAEEEPEPDPTEAGRTDAEHDLRET